MMNNYKLYVHIAPNGKRYYGITKQNLNRRWRNGKGYKNNSYFTNVIQKYGWDNIEHIVLFDSLTESEAKELEQYFIQWYDTTNRNYGYNISTGGEGGNSGCKRTIEWNKKISENHADVKGKNNPNAKPVICITTKRLFITIKDGAEYYSANRNHICSCCRGKQKSTGTFNGQKLVWRYVNYKHNKTYRIKNKEWRINHV